MYGSNRSHFGMLMDDLGMHGRGAEIGVGTGKFADEMLRTWKCAEGETRAFVRLFAYPRVSEVRRVAIANEQARSFRSQTSNGMHRGVKSHTLAVIGTGGPVKREIKSHYMANGMRIHIKSTKQGVCPQVPLGRPSCGAPVVANGALPPASATCGGRGPQRGCGVPRRPLRLCVRRKRRRLRANPKGDDGLVPQGIHPKGDDGL
eukprot:3238041-Pyramimonas_sp.AAC.1